MSPEQLQGRARVASDQYALGIVVYEWLSGERPFQGPFIEMVSQHLFTPPAPLHEKVPAIPPAVEEVVMRALAKDYRQRFASVQAFADALEQISSASSSVSSVSPYAPPIPIVPVIGPTATVVREPSSPLQVPQQLPPASNPSLPIVVPVSADPPTQVQQRLSPGSDPSLPAMVPPRVMQPPQVPQPLPPAAQPVTTDPAWLQQQRRKNVGRNVLLIALALFVVAASSATYIFWPKKPLTQPHYGNGIGVSQVPNGECIGISDGTFAFYTGSGRSDGLLKLQAAAALKNHHVRDAESLWRQAIKQDTNDAEALIYLEDQRVLASHSPYITFVVGTLLTENQNRVSTGRENLRGAYVAQKEFNDGLKLPGGVQVRLLIVNSGNKRSYTGVVAQQIVQAVRADKTIVGVMGWPFSSTSQDALDVLAAAHIPMVSPTAYFDFLTGISPYFFRVIASNKRQVFVGTYYAEHTFHATKAALFVDPTDPYSKELAVDFEEQFVKDGNSIVATEDYTVGHPDQLVRLLQDAQTHNPNLIYFAGYADDVITLLTNLPTAGPLAHLQVIGADRLDGSYPKGKNPNFTRLHFTAFADPLEWDVLGLSAKAPAFFTDYQQAFDPDKQHASNPYGYTKPNTNAMFSYDAMLTLLTGSQIALAGGKKGFSPDDLQQALIKITGSRAIQGATGQISFGPGGEPPCNDPVSKAIVLLNVDQSGNVNMESLQVSLLPGS